MPETVEKQCTSASRAANQKREILVVLKLLSFLRWILALIGLFIVLVTFTPIDRWWARSLVGPWEDFRGDTLIVLGASGAQDGIIPYDTYVRCEYAVRVYREGWVQHLLVSGGGGRQHPVALAMRDFLIGQGIPPSVIITEDHSNSTRENALFLKPILEQLGGTPVLLTSDYHVYRALRVFRRANVRLKVRPVPDVLKRSSSVLGRWPAFLVLCEEAAKITYYKERGWM